MLFPYSRLIIYLQICKFCLLWHRGSKNRYQLTEMHFRNFASSNRHKLYWLENWKSQLRYARYLSYLVLNVENFREKLCRTYPTQGRPMWHQHGKEYHWYIQYSMHDLMYQKNSKVFWFLLVQEDSHKLMHTPYKRPFLKQ